MLADLPDSTRALIADLATESARRHGLNAVDLYRRVLARLEQRKARAALPFKRCPVCGRQLPARDFAENATRPDGLQWDCRQCSATRQAERRACSCPDIDASRFGDLAAGVRRTVKGRVDRSCPLHGGRRA